MALMIANRQVTSVEFLGHGFFVTLFLGSARLFRRATRHGLEAEPTA
jgi:hypothetical protein